MDVLASLFKRNRPEVGNTYASRHSGWNEKYTDKHGNVRDLPIFPAPTAFVLPRIKDRRTSGFASEIKKPKPFLARRKRYLPKKKGKGGALGRPF